MAAFEIIETNQVNGKQTYIKQSKHTTRGWTWEIKTFKTEKAAKAWITRRMKEVTPNSMYNPVYTIRSTKA